MKYAVVTFGCRVNQADSLAFEAELLARQAVPTGAEAADVVVVNTCSVTASADQGARQTVRRIARVNPDARIVVTGCYATRCEDDVRTLPNVLHVIRNPDKERFAHLLDEWRLTTDGRRDDDGPCGVRLEPGVAGRTAFTLRVQTGCAEGCTYCIIPATRGAPRSVPPAQVVAGLRDAVRAGFRELVITGVHLGSYGRDLTPRWSLRALLEALAEAAPSDVRIRISSLEPMDCGRDIVRLVTRSPVFAPHFHLPLQHAADQLLTAMGRPYGLAQYADLVGGIRHDLPDAAIGTDVIVGFPGETESQFEALASYLAASPITHVHVFPYSDRPGTAATGLPGKVSGVVTRERARRIRAISADLTAAFRRRQIGRVHKALALEDGTLALTGNFLKVRIPPGRARNDWLNVRVTRASGEGVEGLEVEGQAGEG